MPSTPDWKASALFLLLAFSLSWAIAFVYFGLGGTTGSPLYMVVGVLYMWGPATAAFVVQRWKKHIPLRALGLAFRIDRWLLFAILFPITLSLMAWGLSFLWPEVSFSADVSQLRPFAKLARTQPEVAHMAIERLNALGGTWGLLIISILASLALGPTLNALIAFGEELGWRGFLFVEWRPLGFWRSAYLTGVVWGLWHTPLILQGHNYPQHPHLGVGLMILFTTLLAPFLSLVRECSGSVWHAAIFHGTLNAIAGITLFTKGGDDLTASLTGFPGLLTLLLANALLWLYLHKTSSSSAAATEDLSQAPGRE